MGHLLGVVRGERLSVRAVFYHDFPPCAGEDGLHLGDHPLERRAPDVRCRPRRKLALRRQYLVTVGAPSVHATEEQDK